MKTLGIEESFSCCKRKNISLRAECLGPYDLSNSITLPNYVASQNSTVQTDSKNLRDGRKFNKTCEIKVQPCEIVAEISETGNTNYSNVVYSITFNFSIKNTLLKLIKIVFTITLLCKNHDKLSELYWIKFFNFSSAYKISE